MPPADLPAWLAAWRLPAPLEACPTLDRDDLLLLKALVDIKSWHVVLVAHIRDRGRPGPKMDMSGVAAFDLWRGRAARADALRGARARRRHESLPARHLDRPPRGAFFG